MNAKKIMGAVLVALLAAALFTGAVAADKTDLGSVFIYQPLNPVDFPTGSWTSGVHTISVVAGTDSTGATKNFFDGGENFVEGVYENATAKVTVKYPTATISGVATVWSGSPAAATSIQYMIIGGTLYSGDHVTLTTTPTSGVAGIRITYPDNSVVTESSVTEGELDQLGAYTLQAVFNANAFVNGTPAKYLYAKDVYTVTVADATTAEITSDVETVIESGVASVVVTAKPGSQVTLTAEKLTFVSINGAKTDANGATVNGKTSIVVEMPNTGVTTIYVKAGTDTGVGKVKIPTADKSVSISITAGAITAKAEKDSYYIGDTVKITGTSTSGKELYVYIEGTNVELTNIEQSIAVKSDGSWEAELTYNELLKNTQKDKLDAGTYTIYISNKDSNTGSSAVTSWSDLTPKASDIKTYTTVSVALKQPFISITDAPSVAVKGADYKVTGTVEATEYIYFYVFGTNFFAAQTNKAIGTDVPGTPVKAGTLEANAISVENNEFTIEFEIPETEMAAGQYFMVVQHPMYDGFFNIWANETKITTAPTVGKDLQENNKTVLFDVSDRQSANAAQALCDALDTQNIDDMYVKLSFIVANGVSTINPIPAEITQGSKLTVSGQTNTGAGKIVTVEILSTAFAAVPKETVGSASFIALTTKTNEDGTWEVTFDTTGLNVDEYTVSVAVAELDSTSTKINIIEGAPTENPTENPTEQPTQTEQPTTPPTTPGFGALAALAGLGAVAVLLLRRE